MKYEPLKLAQAVRDHRSIRTGDVPFASQNLREVQAHWLIEQKPLKAELERAKEEHRQAQNAYDSARKAFKEREARWKAQIKQGRENRSDMLPRFTDEIKKLAWEEFQSGASYSTIRVALGVADLNEAKILVEEGRTLTEEGDW